MTASGRLGETARRAGIASFIALSCSAFALVWASFTNDYSVAYILQHTNRDLNTAYKFSALWSGQEGSLLLWAWAAQLLRLRAAHASQGRRPPVGLCLDHPCRVQVFFLLLLNFAAPPFAIQPGPLAQDGFGLNPLLQYPEMVIHPPMLYLGYVGFSVPFAFALGALMMRYPGEKWIHITRRWTMVTWLFLTCGIILGAHWAYSVLGWGGLLGVGPRGKRLADALAYRHGLPALGHDAGEARHDEGLERVADLLHLPSDYSGHPAYPFGTGLQRPRLCPVFYRRLVLRLHHHRLRGLPVHLLQQKDHLKSENRLESLVSRESSFLFNNLILLTACFTVLWGTLFPVLSEYVQGSKVTVGAPFYNRVNLPIGLFLLFLTGIGPLLAWRSTSLRSIRRNFVMPCIAMAVMFAVCVIAGVRPWSAGDDMQAEIFSLITFTLSAGVITAIFTEFLRGASVVRTQTGKNLFASTVLLVRRNTRRYGGYVVHFGIVVMFIGIAGGAFNQSREQEMGFGDSVQLGSYKLFCQSFTQDSNPNFDTEYALLDVFRNGKKLTQLAPERRFYIASQTPSTMVALHSTLIEDLYVIYEGKNPDTGKADHQGLHQSIGELDLDRRHHRRPWHLPCAGT